MPFVFIRFHCISIWLFLQAYVLGYCVFCHRYYGAVVLLVVKLKKEFHLSLTPLNFFHYFIVAAMLLLKDSVLSTCNHSSSYFFLLHFHLAFFFVFFFFFLCFPERFFFHFFGFMFEKLEQLKIYRSTVTGIHSFIHT